MFNKPFSLESRTLEFSKSVLLFCKEIKPSIITRPLIDQIVRSATSIGANYTEANNGVSKADFRNKIYIAKKEASETKYWLSLLEDLVENKEECLRLYQECHYLLMTFQKIVTTIDNGKQKTYSKQ